MPSSTHWISGHHLHRGICPPAAAALESSHRSHCGQLATNQCLACTTASLPQDVRTPRPLRAWQTPRGEALCCGRGPKQKARADSSQNRDTCPRSESYDGRMCPCRPSWRRHGASYLHAPELSAAPKESIPRPPPVFQANEQLSSWTRGTAWRWLIYIREPADRRSWPCQANCSKSPMHQVGQP